LSVHRKVEVSYRGFSAKGTAIYDDWVAIDCNVMTWLLNSMAKRVSVSVMFLKTVKKYGRP